MNRMERKYPIIGDRLRLARKLRGWQQDDLANKTGLKQGMISAFETGRQFPYGMILIKIALALNVSTDYIYGLSDTPELPRSDVAISTVGLTMEQIHIIQMLATVLARENHG